MHHGHLSLDAGEASNYETVRTFEEKPSLKSQTLPYKQIYDFVGPYFEPYEIAMWSCDQP